MKVLRPLGLLLTILFVAPCWAARFTISTWAIEPGSAFNVSWSTETETRGMITVRDLSGDVVEYVVALQNMASTRWVAWVPSPSLAPGTYFFHLITHSDGQAVSAPWVYREGVTSVDEKNLSPVQKALAPRSTESDSDSDSESPSSVNLSPGEKAGVAIGSIIGGILVILLSIWCCCWPPRQHRDPDRFHQGGMDGTCPYCGHQQHGDPQGHAEEGGASADFGSNPGAPSAPPPSYDQSNGKV